MSFKFLVFKDITVELYVFSLNRDGVYTLKSLFNEEKSQCSPTEACMAAVAHITQPLRAGCFMRPAMTFPFVLNVKSDILGYGLSVNSPVKQKPA